MILAMVILFVVLLIMGAPIFFGLGGITILPRLVDSSMITNAGFLTRLMVGGLDSTVLLAVPLFILSGTIMGAGGLSKRMFNVFSMFVGKKPAGIPTAVILTSILYGAICGAGAAAAAAVGAMAIPFMTELGYDKRFSAAIVAAGGGIGLIIPPSLGYVVYGSMTGTSVGALFTAGFLPGIVIGLILIIYSAIFCRKNGVDQEKLDKAHAELVANGKWKVFKESFWALLAPVIILGCIYGGITTPTEAAVISVWYSLIICLFVYKTLTIRGLIDLLKESVDGYVGITIVTAFGMGLNRVFELLNMPTTIANYLTTTFSNSNVLLFAIILVLLFIGMFMDVMPTLIIFSPLLYKVMVTACGMDPVHFGIILTMTVSLGLVSPPYGLNIFVSANIAKIDAGTMFKQCIAVSICYFLSILIIAYVPEISLFLPRVFGIT